MKGTNPLSGMTAVVTGGGGSIGSASALRLLEDGAAVLLMGRRLDMLERARMRLLDAVPAGRVEISAGDAGSPEDVRTAMAQASNIAGRLDIVVATVGGSRMRPILMEDIESFSEIVSLNLITAFLAIRHGAPLLTRGGSIVCISSNAAGNVTPWRASYMAGKGAMEQLARCAAEELASAGIRVNVVRPGITRTDEGKTTSANPDIVKEVLAEVPLARVGEPADIAAAVRYLAGPESGWVTGQIISVDGGGELRKNPRMMGPLTATFGETAVEAIVAGRVP